MCIYAQFVGTAKKALSANGTPQIKVATVVNFPHGGDDVEKAVKETREAVAAGADEIDVVFPYKRLLAGDEDVGKELVERVKAECTGPVLLKVIIETGELKEAAMIKRASEIAIGSGADFIKTSTGKVAVPVAGSRIWTKNSSGEMVSVQPGSSVRGGSLISD